MKTMYCLIIFLAAIFQIAPSAQATWYEETKYHCSDPFNVHTFLFSNGWITQPFALNYDRENPKVVYATINAEEIQIYLNNAHEFETKQLTADDAKLLVKSLDRSSKNNIVPLLLQIGPSIFANYTLSPAGSSFVGSFFTYLFDQANVNKASFDTIITLIANGGKLKHLVTLRKDEHRTVFLNNIFYTVKVGEELREVLLYSCSYPTNIKIDRIWTTVGVNDKVISEEASEEADVKWYVFTSNTQEKDPGYLKKTHEDDDYYYFEDYGVSNYFTYHRIHRHGGAWEVRSDGEDWQNLYSTTTTTPAPIAPNMLRLDK